MGAANAKRVYALYPRLTHRAKVALLFMALTALDDDNPDTGKLARRYFGGRAAIAEALGYDLSTPELRATAFSEVHKVTSQLRAAGAIELVKAGRAGVGYSEYLVRTEPVTPRGGVTHPLQEGRQTPPLEGRRTPPVGGRWTPPQEEVGTTEDNRLGQLPSGASPHVGRATTTANPDGPDEYDRAHELLMAAGPVRQERALAAARASDPEADMRTSVIAAARVLEQIGARA